MGKNKEEKINNKKDKNKNNKQPINWTKLFTKIMIWFMLFVMIAFFVATIVWGMR